MRRYLRAVRRYSFSWGGTTSRFLRVKAILSAAVIKVHARYVLSTTTTTPRRQSRRLGKRGWRVAVWTSFGGLEGRRGCGVSGISSWDRERHFVPPRTPLLESEEPSWGSGSHKWPSPRPTRVATNTKSIPPTIPIIPLLSLPLWPSTTSLSVFSFPPLFGSYTAT